MERGLENEKELLGHEKNVRLSTCLSYAIKKKDSEHHFKKINSVTRQNNHPPNNTHLSGKEYVSF